MTNQPEHPVLAALREALAAIVVHDRAPYQCESTEGARGAMDCRSLLEAAIPQLEALLAERAEIVEVLQSCEHLAEREAATCQSTEYAAGADRRLARIRALLARIEGGNDG